MVLRSAAWSALALCVAAGAAGCIHRVPQATLAPGTSVAVAYYVDAQRPDPPPMPSEVRHAVTRALAVRNGAAQEVPGVTKLRTTTQRLAQLAHDAHGANLVLLVETRVVFFAQMEGRFKWTVYTKLTLAEPDALPSALTRTAEASAFLRFDHQQEPDALADAADSLAESAGRLVDEHAAGQAVSPAPSSAAAPASAPPPSPAANAPHAAIEPPRAIYMVLVDRFADGDPSNDRGVDRADPEAFHGGDLQGVIDHLDHIQKLGFDTVWISPVWKCRHAKFHGHGAFHGYWVDDFAQVDPAFGNRRLLQRLSAALHQRHMKLVLDVVLNHVAFDSPLLKAHPEWFHHNGDIKDWNDPVQLVNNDVMGLPDLAQEREDVYQYLLKTSKMWIDAVHPDGFRLDAVKHVSRAFWKRYNADLHAYAGTGFFLLGEDLDGDPVTLSAEAKASGFDAVFDFPLYFAIKDVFCDGKPLGELAAVLSQDDAYAPSTRHVTLVDNHDLPRLATACHGDRKRIAAALDFLFAVRGIPQMTYGTEAGLTGADIPQNRGDMVFGSPTALGAQIATDLSQPAARGPANIEALSADRLVVRRSPSSAIEVTRDRVTVGPAAPAPDVGARDVRFTVDGAPQGEQVAVGAGAHLGDWHPEHGVRVGGSGLRLPGAAVYAYKLAVRRADGTWMWEPRGNRYLFVPPGPVPLAVHLRWASD